MNKLGLWLGRRIGGYLSRGTHTDSTSMATDPGRLAAALRPGDVLLVEGNTRLSVVIKYLTQSTWSHAALYVGETLGRSNEKGESLCFIEADVNAGVRAVPLSAFGGLHTRICRPVNLSPRGLDQLLHYACARIGHQYDLRNVFNLAGGYSCSKKNEAPASSSMAGMSQSSGPMPPRENSPGVRVRWSSSWNCIFPVW